KSPSALVLDYSAGLAKAVYRYMPLKQAARELGRLGLKCSEHCGFENNTLLILPDKSAAADFTGKIIGILKNFSPRCETDGCGGFFADLTGTSLLFGRPLDTALVIIKKIRMENIISRAGLASSRSAARFAAQAAEDFSAFALFKSAENAFIYNLPAAKTLEYSLRLRLSRDYNIERLGDLACFTEQELFCLLGPAGKSLYRDLHNLSGSLTAAGAAPEITAERILPSASADESLRTFLFEITLEACEKMRSHGVFPGRFTLGAVYSDNREAREQKKIRKRSNLEADIYHELLPVLNIFLQRRCAVKKLILKFSSLCPAFYEIDFFGSGQKQQKLAETFDRLRSKYGKQALFYIRP
ncbi:MAG TPA: hypothetical protein DC049_20285, partial [Spirochaetia bacterium]|nr:hypothetical protein [Spirochaetia bacterium]